MYQFLVPEEQAGLRVDKFLHEALGDEFSRTVLQKLIKERKVKVGKKVITKVAHVLETDQEVFLDAEAGEKSEQKEILAEDIPLEILFEDDDVLVISKTSGMCVHPDHAYRSGTVVNAVMGYLTRKNLSSLGGLERPGIVHRLDKDTSGCLMIAKNDKAHKFLSKEIAERKIKKHYCALVLGRQKVREGTIDAPIGRDKYDRKKMAISTGSDSRNALTHFTLEAFYENPTSSLLDIQIITGRTHQIRVHLESIGFPILGDEVYGNSGENEKFFKDFPISRIFLHARSVEFTLPSGKNLKVEAPFPEDLEKTIGMLEC